MAPPEERARLLGLLGAAFGLGFVAGPAIGGLAALGGPEVPFLLAAAIAAVNAVVAAKRLPETHGARGAGEARPLLERVSWRRAGVVELVVGAFMALTAFSAFEATFALFAEHRLGLRLASIGGVFAGVGLVLVLVQVRLLGPTVARYGEGGTLRRGLVLNGMGLLLVAAAHSWWLLAPALLALVVGQGLVTPTLSSILAGRVGADRRGAVLGVQQAAGGLARVVGPLAGGVAFEHVGVPAPYLAGAALTGLAVVVTQRHGAAVRP
jgi:DHA1 family tetracycline resistance protein-like MFS transporter